MCTFRQAMYMVRKDKNWIQGLEAAKGFAGNLNTILENSCITIEEKDDHVEVIIENKQATGKRSVTSHDDPWNAWQHIYDIESFLWMEYDKSLPNRSRLL